MRIHYTELCLIKEIGRLIFQADIQNIRHQSQNQRLIFQGNVIYSTKYKFIE